MKHADELVRSSVRNLQPYTSARDESNPGHKIYLDANENPFGVFNRYPDPYQKELKETLSALKNTDADKIFLGNGSDEIIDLLYRVFCQPGSDKIMICPPTYGMYKVIADIQDLALIQVPLLENFQLDTVKILEALQVNPSVKMILFCSPNNPTGNTLSDIKVIMSRFQGITVVDEAYIDFSDHGSLISCLDEYPNLVVIQTMSKAWGLASVRLGMAFAARNIIRWLNKVKAPYNISGPNQAETLRALENAGEVKRQIDTIKKERSIVTKALSDLTCIQKIYPSDANFLLIQVENADDVYHFLLNHGIVVRNRHQQIPDCLRITVGSPDENAALLRVLQTYNPGKQISNQKHTL